MFVPENTVARGRYLFLAGVVIVFFLLLIGRFYSLQIHQHEKYISQADANRIREVSQQGPRGLIFDRYGTLLVDNRFTYMLSAIPWEIEQSPQVLSELSGYLDVERNQLESRLEDGYQSAFVPVRLASGLQFSTISVLEEHRLDFPGVILSNDPIRFYASDANLSHVLGYLREIDRNELEKFRRTKKYQLGDLVGWNGLERQYEDILCGIKGYQYIQINAIGQEIGPVEDREPIQPEPGYNLYLSLDAQLQEYVESLFDTLRGTAVVLKPASGEVLTFMSAPSYDLSLFSGAIQAEEWQSLQADTSRPLFNRAAVGMYPPGSTFKLISVIAALEENIVSTDWTVECPGYYRLGRRVFRCWKAGGHGEVDMYDAVEQSCNVYFYTLIRKIGIDNWAKYAKMFGFGTRTGIDLPEEAAGLIPDREWMDDTYGVNGWTEGHLLNMTVGQGNILVTPLQMAHFAGVLAMDGLVTTPHFGVAYETEDGELTTLDYPVKMITEVDTSTYRILRESMFQVVNGENGTGRVAQLPDVEIMGKTGTAQNPHGEDHAWFIGTMKEGDDLTSLAVMVENGGSGGSIAAPIAGRIFYRYLQLKENEDSRTAFDMITENVASE